MPQPAFMVGQIKVKDFPEYFERYASQVRAQAERFGGEFLVATTRAEVTEGEWNCNWTVVIRFPSKEAAMGFYHSPGYAPLKALRIDELTESGNLVLLPGLDLATQ
jgi:uncharacterized protein (DUF1330 family)